MKLLAKLSIPLIFVTNFYLSDTLHAADQEVEVVDPYADSYTVLDNPQPTTVEEGKIEVLEIFSYMCPHCFHFNNFLQGWLETKAEDIEFVHLPVVFGKNSWKPSAKAYFTAKNLGVLDKVHNPIFESIHKNNKPLNSEKSLARLFKEHGVEEQTFSEMYNSFSVDMQVRGANTQANKYGANSVPMLIVNGKYRISTGKAGGYKQMMQIVDYLVEKERAVLSANSANTESEEIEKTEEKVEGDKKEN